MLVCKNTSEFVLASFLLIKRSANYSLLKFSYKIFHFGSQDLNEKLRKSEASIKV